MYFVSSHIYFFFNDTATTEIYTLSLHDALPIWGDRAAVGVDHVLGAHAAVERLVHVLVADDVGVARRARDERVVAIPGRSEEHTSELQSRQYLVCRLLLEKKNTHPSRTTLDELL